MKLVTVTEMRQMESEAHQGGMSYLQMIEQAGQGVGAWVNAHIQRQGKAIGLIGPGNNGGDTLIALEFLSKLGWQVGAYVVLPRKDEYALAQRLVNRNNPVIEAASDLDFSGLDALLKESATILDGILGTGVHLPLKAEVTEVLKHVHTYLEEHPHQVQVIAVDCPSGVDCDSGEASPDCLPTNTTICMEAVKVGLLSFPAFAYVGNLEVVPIGFPDNLPTTLSLKRSVVSREMVQSLLPPRKLDAHKGTFGTTMIVAGSINYPGASLLAGKAAYRVGTGLVQMAVIEPVQHLVSGQFPEAVWLLLSQNQGAIAKESADLIRQNLQRVSCMLMGSGWGLADSTLEFLEGIIGSSRRRQTGNMGFLASPKESHLDEQDLPPLVIDADGLKLLAKIDGWDHLISTPAILTPHPGEMSILCGLSIDEIQAHRLEVAERFAQKWGHVVVLKGACTIISEPEGNTAIIPVASPALARAGSGDVLAGMIAGLRAQGMKPFEAAFSGAWLHANAGLHTARQTGNTASILAGDILKAVPEVISSLQ